MKVAPTPPSEPEPERPSIEEFAHGVEKISVIVTRKTGGDLIISQHSAERWFRTEEESVSALRDVLEATIKLNDRPPHD